MFYVYLLDNKEDSSLYTGLTKDLRKRLEEHNRGYNKSTKGKKWKCVYYEACLNEDDAIRRER